LEAEISGLKWLFRGSAVLQAKADQIRAVGERWPCRAIRKSSVWTRASPRSYGRQLAHAIRLFVFMMPSRRLSQRTSTEETVCLVSQTTGSWNLAREPVLFSTA
jgi:hypothetical protein